MPLDLELLEDDSPVGLDLELIPDPQGMGDLKVAEQRIANRDRIIREGEERMVDPYPASQDNPIYNELSQLNYGVTKGLANLGSAVNQAGAIAADVVLPAFPQLSQSLQERANLARKGAQLIEQEAGAQSDIGGGSDISRALGEGAISILPAITPWGVTGGAIAGGLQSGLSTLTDAQEAYEQQGKVNPRLRATVPALGSGLITAAVTAAGGKTGPEALSSLIQSGTWKQLGKTILNQSGIEASEEMVDQLGQGILQKATYEPNKSFDQIAEEMIQAGFVGGVLGGGTATMGGTDLAQQQIAPLIERAKAILPKAAQAVEQTQKLPEQPPTALVQPPISTDASPAQQALDEINAELEKTASPDLTLEPVGETSPIAPTSPSEPTVGTVPSPGETAPIESTPTLEQDIARYQSIQSELQPLIAAGDLENPRIQELWAENEAIKNRHGGMPPGTPPTPTLEPDAAIAQAKSELETEPTSNQPLPVEQEPTVATVDEPATNEPKPELVGMGGAIESEFVNSPQTATSIKNAKVEEERAKRGLPSAIQPARRTFGRVWDEAMAEIDRDPAVQDTLINELRDTPRALTDREDALLLHRQIDLHNEHGKATRDLAQAFEDGRMDDVKREQERVDRLSDTLLDLYNINKKVGTETGRGLAARKMMAYEDFTLANLEATKRAALGGRQLTPSERAELVKIADDYKAKSEALEKSLAEKDARLAELESQRSFAEMQKEARKEPGYSDYVIQAVEKIVSKLEKRATAAESRLAAKLARASAGVDPTILLDVSEIAAYHIARKGLDFAKWAKGLSEKYGASIDPYLEPAWQKGMEMVDSEVNKLGPKKEQVRVTIKKDNIQETAASLKQIAQEDINNLPDLGVMAHRLAKQFVASGIKTRNEVIDAVYDVLKEAYPDLTRRQTMDAISGYGDFKQLSKSEVDKELRDLKGQMQQIGKLEDMAAGNAPKKTGVERRTPSDEERRLIKLVEEAKRKGGYKVTDTATQLRTALGAIKTRLRNQIKDLELQIATRAKILKTKTPPPTDTEADALKKRRDELKKEFDSIFPKSGITDAQRVRNAIAATERSIAEYERRIKEGDLFPGKKPSKTPLTPELAAARARRDALKAELEELQELAQPKKTPEERALQSWKTRTANRMAELEERLAKKDFSPKPKREIVHDPESTRLKYQLEEVKRRWYEGLFNDKLAKRTKIQKVLGGAAEVINSARALITSFDLSAVLRQGGFISFAHPIRSAKAFPSMIKALRSKEGEFSVMEEIFSRPNARLYEQGKLYFANQQTGLSAMEEAYMSRWAEKIPGVGASQRAYVTFLNRLRADSFDAMVNGLTPSGTPTPEEAKAIANFVNVSTGRGNFGQKENAAVALNTIFFAPRYVASRFQLLAGQPLMQGNLRTRKLIAKEYGRFIAAMAVVYALAMSAGGEVEDDPRSTDFMKIRFGDTRIDPLSGLIQITVLLSRLISGEKKTLKGKVVPIRGKDVPYGGGTSFDVVSDFARSKLAPAPAELVNAMEGKNIIGQPWTIQSAFYNQLPLGGREIYESAKVQGVPEATAIALLISLGIGVQTYGDNPKPETPR